MLSNFAACQGLIAGDGHARSRPKPAAGFSPRGFPRNDKVRARCDTRNGCTNLRQEFSPSIPSRHEQFPIAALGRVVRSVGSAVRTNRPWRIGDGPHDGPYSPNTSASKQYICASGFFQASSGKAALRHVCARNSSRVQPRS